MEEIGTGLHYIAGVIAVACGVVSITFSPIKLNIGTPFDVFINVFVGTVLVILGVLILLDEL